MEVHVQVAVQVRESEASRREGGELRLDLAAAVRLVRERFGPYQGLPLGREEVDGTTIIAAWLRDRGAGEGILLPLDGPDAIIDRLDELTVTIRDLRLPGPLPAIDGLA